MRLGWTCNPDPIEENSFLELSHPLDETANKPPPIDDRPLPPVEPPSPGFILQLFVIPLVIVTIIVMVWLMFSWLAHMGSDPQELVRDLRTPNQASWQKALTLAELLRDPSYEDLKRDVGIATELARVLEAQLEEENYDETSVQLRMFLCRALGEFQVPQTLPSLVKAATVERDPAEIDVRDMALQALATFAANNGPEVVRSNEACMEALKVASRERTDVDAEKQARDALRSTAAFVLGVIGGEQALDRLAILLNDSNANVRYNAATGLCRHGDLRAKPVLVEEMLDPNNEAATSKDDAEYGDRNRLQVIKNGISGASQLAEKCSPAEVDDVRAALQSIVDSDLALFNARLRNGIRSNAKEALQAMKATAPIAD